jgi:hypothetical protein
VTKAPKTTGNSGKANRTSFAKGNPGKQPGTVAKVPKAWRDWLRGELGTDEWREMLMVSARSNPNVLMWAFDQAFGKAKITVETSGSLDVIAYLSQSYEVEHAKLQALALERARKAQAVADLALAGVNDAPGESGEEGETNDD